MLTLTIVGCGVPAGPSATEDRTVGGAQWTTERVQHLLDAAELAGGGEVILPPGEIVVTRTLEIGNETSLRGAGRGVTVLRAAPGCNCDVIRTRRFAVLTGRPCLSDSEGCVGGAPRHVAIRHLTIDGGYLDGDWNHPNTHAANRRGSGLRMYARLFDIDIEVRNVAEHALYLEGSGPRGAAGVHSRVRMSGRVSGQEAVVFRGPGDVYLEEIVFGLAGIAPISEARRSLARSATFTGAGDDGIDGLVVDGSPGYEGNVEVGLVHIYACYNGYGVRARGTVRLEAAHLISESNLGGLAISGQTYGAVNLLSVRSSGRHHPNLEIPPPSPRPGLLIEGRPDGQTPGVVLGAFYCFRSIASGAQDGWPCAEIVGDHNTLNVHHRNSRDPTTGRLRAGDAIVIRGSGNVVRANLGSVVGDGVVVAGSFNVIDILARGGTGVAIRRTVDGVGGGEGNRVSGVVEGWPLAFRSIGRARAELIDLTVVPAPGGRAACGTCPVSSSQWRFLGPASSDAPTLFSCAAEDDENPCDS